jgi:competence ComEA-like helix-hairpin-helix protein
MLLLLLALGAAADLLRVRMPGSLPPVPAASGAPDATAAPESLARGPAAPHPLAGRVDLARAGVAELDALPGIGPVLAARIVAHRERQGAFRAVEDLLAVPGIGPRLLERLRPLLTVGSGGAVHSATPTPGGEGPARRRTMRGTALKVATRHADDPHRSPGPP